MSESQPGASTIESLPRVQRVAAVLWPSFVLAGFATIVFFALIDPFSMIDYDGAPPLSRTAAYSLGFFGFWLLTGAACLATLYLLSTRIPPPRHFDDAPQDSADDADDQRH